MSPILEVKNLTVACSKGVIVKEISFCLYPGHTLALVGESGSGKSVTALAILGLFRIGGLFIQKGEILFLGEDLIKKTEKELRSYRGTMLSFIRQNPLNSLNPTLTIGLQLMEAVKEGSRATKRERALSFLQQVGIADANSRMKSYPHELSGGMRQRVLIAMALINGPKVLIADEPTTALDVTIQAQILDLLLELQEKTETSILFISHDMGVVARLAHEVCVMKEGEIVEKGTVEKIFYDPEHPYTQLLLSSYEKCYC